MTFERRPYAPRPIKVDQETPFNQWLDGVLVQGLLGFTQVIQRGLCDVTPKRWKQGDKTLEVIVHTDRKATVRIRRKPEESFAILTFIEEKGLLIPREKGVFEISIQNPTFPILGLIEDVDDDVMLEDVITHKEEVKKPSDKGLIAA